MKNKKNEFVVCDRGIGIPKSLKSSGLNFGALAKAIEQGVTRDKSYGQGNGLYGSYRIAVKSGAHFSAHSGNATLYFTPKTGMRVGGNKNALYRVGLLTGQSCFRHRRHVGQRRCPFRRRHRQCAQLSFLNLRDRRCEHGEGIRRMAGFL
jgi:hypothetical protein